MTQTFLKPGPKRWRQVMKVAGIAALIAMGTLYVNYAQHESDQRWCRLMKALTTDSPPPTTARAKEIAEILEQMKTDFDC